MVMNNYTNKLIHSKSPYLLQHAHNPVDWYEWGLEALEKSAKENKPMLVSIGYSACHWCHVMEHESFEDEETAELMNKNFVCIKIDREERPDLDNIYMDAVQNMGLHGGWPLNVFLMPDQKPFYGGTYFPNRNFKALLGSIAKAYKDNYEQLAESADGFAASLARSEKEKYGILFSDEELTKEDLSQMADAILDQFDPIWGGLKKSPKFPMPSIWQFLLDFALLSEDQEMKDDVVFTLTKIGMGGIYDHLGGGFARYSVDGEWFAPHFEKMLYDNGQLLYLYSKAYQISQEVYFKEKIEETVGWLEREMQETNGGFYAALDADSEGEEGKFYTWKTKELEDLFKDDFAWFSELYNLKPNGNWENGVNILFQTEPYETIARHHQIPLQEFQNKIQKAKTQLLDHRSKRIAPGLDDKVLSGWNGLMISGLVQAYIATDNDHYLHLAEKNATFIAEHLIKDNNLYRAYKEGTAYNNGFLEDYAAVIEAFINLYQGNFDGKWLFKAKELMNHVLTYFYDDVDQMFYFNNPAAEILIANKKEIFDNVIPSSNSIMARNLHKLGLYFYEEEYLLLSRLMLDNMKSLIKSDPTFLSNWATHYLENFHPTAEIAIVGKGAKALARQLLKTYQPNIIVSASEEVSEVIPILTHKFPDPEKNALLYVCFNRTCKRPTSTLEEALTLLPKIA